MKLSINTAQNLLNLVKEQEELNLSVFKGSGKTLAEELIKEGILSSRRVGTAMYKVRCIYPERLSSYLRSQYQIASLPSYIEFLTNDESTRADAVEATGNSKFKKGKLFQGFLVNALEPIEIIISGEKVIIQPGGSHFTFIHDFNNIVLDKGITIVGVEGFECFKQISKQKELFAGTKALFLWRYQNSNSITDWLKLIPNKYLHYGDFDLKGIHIYITEFKSKVGTERCDFLIPDKIEEFISHNGSRELYQKQINYLKDFDFNAHQEVKGLANFIKAQKKGLEQEFFIR